MNSWLEKYFMGDRVIWIVVMLLSVFSILAVYSSTGTLAYKYQDGNTEYYLLKHIFILFFGFGLMYFAHSLKYTLYARFANFVIAIAIPLLLLTLILGTNLNEASRWLTLPIINMSFQTSDMAKLALILFVARALSIRQDNIKDFKSAFVPIMLPVLVTCGLILPANFSTAAVLFATCIILMIVGRISFKYIMTLIAIGVVFLGLFIGMSLLFKWDNRVPTWVARMETYTGKGGGSDNYQSQQANIAIAKGGLLGAGPGNSTQRNFLPHPYSDFIYAIIVEEYGLMGGALVVILYLVLFFRSVRIARNSPRAFATFAAIGCGFSLSFQAMINMAVTVGLFPVTGQPLPLLSMGGTSIWFTSIAIGIILSVSRDVEEEGGLQRVEG
ncbi:MAG: FtsW/RodA/SpoVE family cell cycle protein [Bacteroidota bacterium]|jgi:cell division protein FtsW